MGSPDTPHLVLGGVQKWGPKMTQFGVFGWGLYNGIIVIFNPPEIHGCPESTNLGYGIGPGQVWTSSERNILFWNIPVPALWMDPGWVIRGLGCSGGVQKGSRLGSPGGVPDWGP